MKKSILILGLMSCLTAHSATSITYNFNFDASVPPAAQTAANQAAAHMSSLFTGPVNSTIDIDFSFSNLGSSLGTATVGFTLTSGTFGIRSYGLDRALTGVDPDVGSAEMTLEFNSATNWSYTSTVGATEYSFFDVVIHEVVHGMGFVHSIFEDGSDRLGNTGTAGDPGIYSIYDSFLGDASGGNIISNTGVVDFARWNPAVTGGTGVTPPTSVTGTNGLYFYGPNAMAANSGQPVPLYTPGTYAPGSSVSHFDTDAYGVNSYALNHAISNGSYIGGLQALDLGVLADVGFTIIPEPSSSSLLALGLLGLVTRRRRS